MVSDQDLARYVDSLLRQTAAVSGGGISPEAVVRQLETQLGVDLSHKAAFIRDLLLALLAPTPPPRKGFFAPSPPSSSSSFPQPPQFHSYPPAPQYHHHRLLPPAASTAVSVSVSPYDHLPSFRYQQPFAAPAAAAGGTQLQRLVQQLPQQQMVAAAAAEESPRAPPPSSSQKESSTIGVKRRGGPGGLNKVCGVSPELQAIVGEPTMARTEIVKQLWAYIRRNNLQDPNNKRKIICNDALRLVFETDCTDMFKMNKLLAKHIIPLGSTKDLGRDSKKLKPAASELVSSVEADVNRSPIVVSDALANFFGTGEREMPQSEAIKRVWDHIKSNNLEDPTNPMVILCDSKLKQLFGCESLSALGVSELLSRHLFKQS